MAVTTRLHENYDDLGTGFPLLFRSVMARGFTQDSRIGQVREVLNLQLHLRNPLPCLIGRKGMSTAFAYEEIRQILAGEYDGERLGAIVPQAAILITPATAYGPRVCDQLLAVEAELKESPLSRRAVVYVGKDTDLTWIGENTAGEMPCTCLWQFQLRDGRLYMTVTMRSWDLIWGLSYDVPSFVAVQAALAKALGAELGSYTHNAGNAHIYDRHWDIPVWEREDELDLSNLLMPTMYETQERARSL